MKFLALDANSIVNRAFYGVRPLITKDGVHTNAIYGFLSILYKLISEETPDYIVCAFDLKSPTFRHKIYSEYKAGRKSMPEELRTQIPLLKEVLASLNISCLEKEGFEADDILGTISNMCSQNNIECIIATGDRDSLQLINKFTTVKLAVPKTSGSEVVVYDENKIKDEYNIFPPEMLDLKAIMGDSSDNIPGVLGIGQKGAVDLISKFHNIEYIYENIASLDIKEKIREKLIVSKENCFLSKTLGEISKDVKIEQDLNFYKTKSPDMTLAFNIFTKLELKSFISKLGLESTDPTSNVANVTTLPISFQILSEIEMSNKMTFCSNDSSYNNISIAYNNNVYTLSPDNENEQIIKKLLSIFENDAIIKITHDAKHVASSLLHQNSKLDGLFGDTKIAAYLLNPSWATYDLVDLVRCYLKINVANIATATLYIEKLHQKESELIEITECTYLYKNVELPLCLVLAKMEYDGFMIDTSALSQYGEMLDEKLLHFKNEIYSLACEEFNINSPKQLGVILFEKLSLPIIKKTKTGYSTNSDVLEKLRLSHPIIDFISSYRLCTKLKSTYVDGLTKVISDDGRIHSSFNQTVTATGRISSTEPNLQNIPIRTELGSQLRKMFVAKEGYVLCDADYSQIELRVLAHIANDEDMICAFNNDEDIHTDTASRVFHVEKSKVTSEMRRKAKAVNFGIVYGISDFSLAGDLKISRNEAKEIIETYLSTYQGVANYMEKSVAYAVDNGFCKTMFNRYRYIPELKNTNKNLQAFGKRIAMNAPIQGSAADIIKIAMVRVYNALVENKLKSKLILQVHDELIVETAKDEVEIVKKIIKDEMENAAQLNVKLVADVFSGNNWYEAK